MPRALDGLGASTARHVSRPKGQTPNALSRHLLAG
jgi:hypothetical protein